jgi:endoglucanase
LIPRVLIVLGALAAILVAAPAASAQSSERECDFPRRQVSGDRQGVSPRAPNPLENASEWYVDPKEPAIDSLIQYGDTPKGRLMARIAYSPRFKWFGRFTSAPRTICRFIGEAESAGKVPLVATLRHQGKQCNPRYQAGGVAEDNATRQWFDDLARGIGSSRVIIAFEPDSVGTIECLAAGRRQARIEVLRHGVDVLSKLPNATVYIEATASDWKSVGYVANRLRQLGVAKVRGFMLNVTHYAWTRDNIRFGRKVSKRLGGKHFVISTAQNGRGPVKYKRGKRGVQVLCHPLYRGAGPYPSTKTADPLVDAYLWINRAGYSGGSCNRGPLPVGTWWPARALMLARYQSQRLFPARGTRYGFKKGRFRIRDVAGDGYRR